MFTIGENIIIFYAMILSNSYHSSVSNFRGHYIEVADEWRRSGLCKLSGFLSTLSSEVSVLTLVFITIDRLVSICFPFSEYRFSMSLTYKWVSFKILFRVSPWFLTFDILSFELLPLQTYRLLVVVCPDRGYPTSCGQTLFQRRILCAFRRLSCSSYHKSKASRLGVLCGHIPLSQPDRISRHSCLLFNNV